jgi:hypothetical protein
LPWNLGSKNLTDQTWLSSDAWQKNYLSHKSNLLGLTTSFCDDIRHSGLRDGILVGGLFADTELEKWKLKNMEIGELEWEKYGDWRVGMGNCVYGD